MRRASYLLLAVGIVVMAMNFARRCAAQSTTPQIDAASAADEALIHCRGKYCRGSYGITGDDTAAKLAIIEIWRNLASAKHLVSLFPKCNGTGQAYVLAALWHLDPVSFRRLVPAFVNGDDVKVAAADVVWSETRSNLVQMMQQTNCSLAFRNPPLTREEIDKLIADDEASYKALFEKTEQWQKAVIEYELSAPGEGPVAGRLVTMQRRGSGMPFSIDWSWKGIGGDWSPSIRFEDVSNVVAEIERTPFIQRINKEVPLDIALYAVNGNFYLQGMGQDMSQQEDEDVTRAKALIRAVGFSGTNRLVQIIARSATGPLELWHPSNTHFWLISWNIKISHAWAEDYQKQTGLALTDLETASGWVGTCDDDGVLTMHRCALAKSIEERVRDETVQREARKITQ
jgi:hypothetical protein